MKPREYQQDAVDKIFEAWEKFQAVCYQLCTGGGKSIIFRMIIQRFYDDRKPIYFVVHTKNLYKQASKHLYKAGIHHGFIAAGYPHLDFRVQIISIASLMSRIKSRKIIEPAAIIIDEGHHITAASYKKMIEFWPKSKVLALTATPIGSGGLGLETAGMQYLICGPEMAWMIDQGYLSDYEYYAPEVGPDFNGIKVDENGEYDREELTAAMRKNRFIIGNAIEHYRKYADGTPAIAFCVSIQHALDVAEEFRAAGYRAVAMHSEMTEDPEEMIEGLASGKHQIICSCEMISEGTDVPVVTTKIDLCPSWSIVKNKQKSGRVLRPVYGSGFYDLGTREGRRAAIAAGPKPKAIMLDCVQNYLRVGMPDDEPQWSLKGKVKGKEGRTLKRCPACFRMIAISSKICPHEDCLHEFTKQKSMIPQEKAGELIKIERDVA